MGTSDEPTFIQILASSTDRELLRLGRLGITARLNPGRVVEVEWKGGSGDGGVGDEDLALPEALADDLVEGLARGRQDATETVEVEDVSVFEVLVGPEPFLDVGDPLLQD